MLFLLKPYTVAYTETMRFCLLMIVRDEESVVRRALNSCKCLMDTFIICDTGSHDRTKTVIEEWSKLNQIHGEIIDRVWKNFGETKSELWSYAFERLKDQVDFFVFLDADEVFITDPNNYTSYPQQVDAQRLYDELQAQPDIDVFKMTTIYASLKYMRWNICRNNQLYVWKQPVHEYLEGTQHPNKAPGDIVWLYNLARKEGNSARNPQRYEEDARMLKEYLQEHPENPRAQFYLAQSYENSGDIRRAQEMYQRRIDNVGGYQQERYIACLRAARHETDRTRKVKLLIQGQSIVPHRIECVYELMMMELKDGNHEGVWGWSMYVPNRAAHASDLFIEHQLYDWKFDFDLAVSCYYAKQYQHGIDANLRALEKAPDHVKERIHDNLRYFEPYKSQQKQTHKSVLNKHCEVNVVIVDNFYEDPMLVRRHALEQSFDVKGNYPGYRTGCQLHTAFCQGMKERFEHLLNKKITYWPEAYNSSFQYALGDMKSWIHRDATDYSAVVYLSPDAPADSGTLFYRFKENNVECSNGDKEVERKLNDASYNEDAWELVDCVGNKFNRCVIFKGFRSHISGKYFGDSKENGRLFQTFFFDCEK